MQVRRYVAVQQSANPRKVGLLVMLWATHGPTGLHHSDPKLIDRAIWPYTKGKSFVESAPMARVGMFPKHHARWQLGATREKKCIFDEWHYTPSRANNIECVPSV